MSGTNLIPPSNDIDLSRLTLFNFYTNARSYNDQDTIESFELGNVAFGNEKYVDAINNASFCLINITDYHLAVLDLRAASRAMAGNFNDALCDANQMIQISPSTFHGFLRGGQIQMLRFNYIQAMNILQQGINCIRQNQIAILRPWYNFARVTHETHFDVFGALPNELATCITEHLTLKERTTLLNVCKLWRNKLIECGSTWRKIQIKPKDRLSMHHMELLGLVSEHITIIELLLLGDSPLYDALFFTILKRLTIKGCIFQTTASLFIALAHIANTLKELEIEFAACDEDNQTWDQMPLPFKTLLSTCQQLEKLRYHDFAYRASGMGSGYLAPGFKSNLTDLDLSFDRIGVYDMKQTIECCPKLKKLVVNDCESTIVDVIFDHCKKLEYLMLNNRFDMEMDNADLYLKNNPHYQFDMIYPDTGDKPYFGSDADADGGGIHSLGISIDKPSNFVALLKDNCSTMKTLKIAFWEPREEWSKLMDVCNFINLQMLSIYTREPQLCRTIATLLKKVPRLIWLHFSWPTLFGSEVWNAITGLMNLRLLELADCTANDQEMRTFFLMLSTTTIITINERGEEEELDVSPIPLDRIELSGNKGYQLDDIVEYCLPYIKTLRHIGLSWSDGPSVQSMSRFCGKLRQHECIESISFAGVDCVNDAMLSQLAEIKTLKNVYLCGLFNVTQRGLSCFESTVQLKLATF
ncbi:hypothetical protein BDA99DRAFT_570964 [Phascolomyces articulosus]|uniref:F-box domain-containing protein n=1 Tax=Phascolomyces articulosus TaxID=60185 RepID=A0AAD5K2N7_9FUNG|nr:hypothetical protein BDA99DRAFT_570964 [Phascolomyces articulosus]